MSFGPFKKLWAFYPDVKKLDTLIFSSPQQGSYKLFIASDVLHVVNYIDISPDLLDWGGRLLLIEHTWVMPFANACIGVRPARIVGWDGKCHFHLLLS